MGKQTEKQKEAAGAAIPVAARLAVIREVLDALERATGKDAHLGDYIDDCIPEAAAALGIPALALAMMTGSAVQPSFQQISDLRNWMETNRLNPGDLGMEA